MRLSAKQARAAAWSPRWRQGSPRPSSAQGRPQLTLPRSRHRARLSLYSAAAPVRSPSSRATSPRLVSPTAMPILSPSARVVARRAVAPYLSTPQAWPTVRAMSIDLLSLMTWLPLGGLVAHRSNGGDLSGQLALGMRSYAISWHKLADLLATTGRSCCGLQAWR
jgi:hypothetical protein